MVWEDRINVKKGNLGEKIVTDWLHKKGLIVYETITDAPHAFDKLVSKGKDILVIAEVKTKPRRMYYPDTGIDIRHYNEYVEVSKKYNIPVCLFFVDEYLRQVYCGYLSELIKPKVVKFKNKELTYPLCLNNIIYFYQPDMTVIHQLSKAEVDEIKKYNSGSYNYR